MCKYSSQVKSIFAGRPSIVFFLCKLLFIEVLIATARRSVGVLGSAALFSILTERLDERRTYTGQTYASVGDLFGADGGSLQNRDHNDPAKSQADRAKTGEPAQIVASALSRGRR